MKSFIYNIITGTLRENKEGSEKVQLSRLEGKLIKALIDGHNNSWEELGVYIYGYYDKHIYSCLISLKTRLLEKVTIDIVGVSGYGLRLDDLVYIEEKAKRGQCDRCGEIYDDEYYMEYEGHKINGMLTANINFRRKYGIYSLKALCPQCCEELIKWLKNEKGE